MIYRQNKGYKKTCKGKERSGMADSFCKLGWINTADGCLSGSLYIGSIGGYRKNMDYVPVWWNMLVVHADWIPLIYFAVISLTMLDKVLITIIIIQSAITKSIFEIIQKTDHKIWRKTGKDSYIANKIWWLQQKWIGLDKRIRAMIIIQFLIAFISWRYFFLMN